MFQGKLVTKTVPRCNGEAPSSKIRPAKAKCISKVVVCKIIDSCFERARGACGERQPKCFSCPLYLGSSSSSSIVGWNVCRSIVDDGISISTTIAERIDTSPANDWSKLERLRCWPCYWLSNDINTPFLAFIFGLMDPIPIVAGM